MPRPYLIAMMVLSSSVLTLSQHAHVHSIEVRGNHFFSSQQILDAMSLKPTMIYSQAQLSHDAEGLLSQYQHEGFSLAAVNDSLGWNSDSSAVEIHLTVEEGPRVAVGRIEFSGNTLLTSSELLERFETRAGGYLDGHLLERDISSVISRYEHVGYPFVKAEVKSIDVQSDGTLSIVIHIDENSKITIDEIKVTGNKETAENVIIRETRIRQHETYDEEKVAKIPQRLNRLNIFSGVKEPEIYQNSGGGGLLISVQEGNTNTFDGIIGYLPGQQGEAGFVTGMVNIAMRNLFGTARKLNVRWQKDERQSQEIGVQYVEPWLFNFPINAGGSFFQRQQDTIYVRRVIDVKGDLLLSESFSLGGILTVENIIPSNTLTNQFVSESRTLTTGIELRYDSRDDIVSPTGGVRYQSGYHIGTKSVSGGFVPGSSGETTVQKLSIDAEFYIEPVVRQVVAIGLHGKQLTSDNIELGDRYRLGGATTLRGYRENQFLGSRIAWTNTEYRFLLDRRSFFYGFFDTGYYYLPGDDAKAISPLQQFKYGYGIGIRLETSLGNVGVSIALGEGDGIGQAKLHFGLINDF